MIGALPQSQMLAYAMANHGNSSVNMRISTALNVDHIVLSTDPYCGSLSFEGFNIVSASGIDSFGNRANYDTTKLIIPIKRKYWSNVIKIMATVKYEGTSDNSKNGYRELQAGVYNYDDGTFSEIERTYFTPPDNSAITTESAIRNTMQLSTSGILSETGSNPANIGVALKVELREGDIFRSARLEIEIYHHA